MDGGLSFSSENFKHYGGKLNGKESLRMLSDWRVFLILIWYRCRFAKTRGSFRTFYGKPLDQIPTVLLL